MSEKFTKISRKNIIDKLYTDEDMIENSFEKDISYYSDNLFFDRALFNFDNNRYANSLFINEFKNKEYSDVQNSSDIKFDFDKTCIYLNEGSSFGEYNSVDIYTHEHKSSSLNNFFLIVDQTIPNGSEVIYYLVTDKKEVLQIRANNTVPYTIQKEEDIPKTVKVRAKIWSNLAGESPKINAIALLYSDDFTEAQMGLINPDLGRLPDTEYPELNDVTTILRDSKNDDKLIKVSNATEDIVLNYAEEGNLDTINIYETVSGDKKEDIYLIYDDYENSDKEVEKVLMQIISKKK
ncbi:MULTISPECIES: hypothetical protein [unclassified Clostridioides]|uniref:hypothetical protein n=1 Tax=unclassified Clostridioides TaxID=2635829 RepID=UPI001D108AE5|nr:hypothetical protein [Clostridioides sp. ES-S-0049-03]MCC0657327.1 hypothetical protein [Clostridioides sp. ES-S-0123-01]MCC0672732.1 hypothetical protein [Clostridioides sp. ES-S-0145-01]MCC0675336.1 hypothetical protein [Clostridioides sp. ES-W-0018-02]MCC0709855.1 hypothetical protein [Clostridioides sp. ES-W-0017-02]UDN59837.1 hypothetical protein JJC01_08240 [Clostridioides sp. ES-S-0010-02]UDN60639.1 hypothetical protein IC758_12320 [Clostridioides sp. ES-W-0016-02]